MAATKTTTHMETEFPAMRVRSDSAHTSETFGAFGEMELTRNNAPKQYPSAEFKQQYFPVLRTDNHGMRSGTADESMDSAIRSERDDPLLLDAAANGRTATVYRPTTTRSEASATSTKKSYDIWVVLLIILGIWAIVLILFGIFNIPFCPVQPMIPIYLIVAGSLFILFSAIRIYNLWPMPEGAHRSTLTANLACRSVEGLLCLAITIWLILGCIWTYGARQYVHFEDAMFELHFCDVGTYWVAFINATLHLTVIALLILGTAFILALGIWKETDMPNNV